MAAPRVMVYSNQDAPLFELDPAHIHEMRAIEAINGEHSLTVTTTQKLDKNQRLLVEDGTGKWREYVVEGVDEEHQGGRRLIGTYYAVWSLQHDLSGTYTTSFPGYDDDDGVLAETALSMLLGCTSRWSVGSVTQTTYGKASFYFLSGWKALSELVSVWGGEVDAVIGVGLHGVISRHVNLHAHLGTEEAVRRFDYGSDLTGIRRKVADGPVTPRIIPMGKNQGDGFRVDIKTVNNDCLWIEDSESAAVYKVPDGNGGWEVPVQVIVNEDAEWPEQLLEWAEDVKEQYTRPKVTYEATVAQLVAAGMDAHGLALGDMSQVVDRTFGDEGLRITGRVVKLDIDELEPANTVVTLGYLSDGFSGVLGELSSSVSEVKGSLVYMSTAAYVDALLNRINNEINATGGYTYIVPGEGIICYDCAVGDPLVGDVPNTNPTEYANKVVQVKGGSVRIADTKKSSFSGINDWNWRTVVTAGQIVVDGATMAHINTGFIGSPSGNYWNLDTGELRMAAASASVGNKSLAQYIAENSGQASINQEIVFKALTGASSVNDQTKGLFISGDDLYVNATFLQSGVLQVKDSNNAVLFKADMNSTPRQVNLAGFTATSSSLYNGLSAISGTAEGVYIGTNGMAVSNVYQENNTDVQHSIALSGGGIQGYKDGSVVGYITPTATATSTDANDNQVTEYGLQMRGDVIDLRSKAITVKNGNSTSGDSTKTVTITGTTTLSNGAYSTRFGPNSLSGNILKGTFRIVFPKYINGLFVGYSTNYWSVIGTEEVSIPLKGYVDDKVSDLNTAISGKASSSALSSLESRVSTLESQMSNMPTFSWNSTTNTLNIGGVS